MAQTKYVCIHIFIYIWIYIQVNRKKAWQVFSYVESRGGGHQSKRKSLKISCPVVHWGDKRRKWEKKLWSIMSYAQMKTSDWITLIFIVKQMLVKVFLKIGKSR